MSVSNSAQPFASALRSSQSICAFLNRFEKDLDEEVIDADMNEAIADEMDAGFPFSSIFADCRLKNVTINMSSSKFSDEDDD